MHDPNQPPQGEIIPECPMLDSASLHEKQSSFAFAVGSFIEERLAESKLPPPLAAKSIAIVYASFITNTWKASKSKRRFVADRMLTTAFGSIADAPDADQH